MGLKATTLVGKSCLVSEKRSVKLPGVYYVTDRMLAMPFPTERKRAIHKLNKVLEIAYHGHYKVFNLCIEQDSDQSHFNAPVEQFPFDDDHLPSLPVIKEFCASVHSWLSTHPKNIAVIYCMAGKYQTGLMVTSYLIYNGMLAEASPQIYADKRNISNLKMKIPSQRRYMNYWKQSLSFSKGCPPAVKHNPCHREFRRIRLYDTKDVESIFFTVSEMQELPGHRYRSSSETCRNFCRKMKKAVFENNLQVYNFPFVEEEEDEHSHLDCYFVNTVQVTGDVCITFYEKDIGGRLFYVCFNTAFIENNSIQFSISEMDKVGNKGKSIAGPEFYVELLFAPANSNEDHVAI